MAGRACRPRRCSAAQRTTGRRARRHRIPELPWLLGSGGGMCRVRGEIVTRRRPSQEPVRLRRGSLALVGGTSGVGVRSLVGAPRAPVRRRPRQVRKRGWAEFSAAARVWTRVPSCAGVRTVAPATPPKRRLRFLQARGCTCWREPQLKRRRDRPMMRTAPPRLRQVRCASPRLGDGVSGARQATKSCAPRRPGSRTTGASGSPCRSMLSR